MKTNDIAGSSRRLQAHLWEIFSKWIRMRDCIKTTGAIYYGHCYTCKKSVAFNEAEAGHFISRGVDALFFDEQNVHLQCNECNCILSGNPAAYKAALNEEFGEGTWEALESRRHEIKQYRAPELLNMIAYYTMALNNLKTLYS